MSLGIAVTGTGAVSSAGADVDAMWAAMGLGLPTVQQVDDEFAHMPVRILHAVDAEVAALPSATGPGTAGRTAALAATAAREALAATGADARPVDPRRVGVVVGTGMGESGEHERRREGAPTSASSDQPLFGVAAEVAHAVGARGPAVSVSNACAASAYAIALAADMLLDGECDAVLVLGAESYSRVALGCFNRMGAVDPLGCRPFAEKRAGTVFGEAAAALVLERTADARRRGAPVLAELLAVATSCDAGHPTAPDPAGEQAARSLREALESAGVQPADVGAVLPHGTGTQLNDAVEADVLRTAFEGRPVPLYSLKALVGHTGGAAGALAAVAAVEIARRSEVPANVDVGDLDPGFRVRVDRSPTPASGAVVVNAYAFGGNNATLVLAGAP